MTNNNISEDRNKHLGKIDLHAELVETGVEQVLIELDKSLIGLEPVKTRIRETAALLLVEKAREKLGWLPKYSLDQLIAEMINQDKKEAEKELILLNEGFIQNDPLETIPEIMGDI